jgi:hypothetical protein
MGALTKVEREQISQAIVASIELTTIVREKLLPEVQRHRNILDGENGDAGLVTQVCTQGKKLDDVFKLGWTIASAVIIAIVGVVWGLIQLYPALQRLVENGATP